MKLFKIGFTVPVVIAFLFLGFINAYGQQTLMHYWNFNEVDYKIPNVTIGGAELIDSLAASSQILTGSGQGFTGENARFGDPAGNHLRLNNPIGSSLTYVVPTTGFENVIFKYETRRSGSGANIQYVSYTVDGIEFAALDTINITETPTVISLDFSPIDQTDNNTSFAVRIEFDDTNEPPNLEGNNRFDNVTLEGYPLEGTNLPPVIGDLPDVIEAVAGFETEYVDLNELWSDPDGDPLTFSAISADSAIATVSVDVDIMAFTPVSVGNTVITLTADDGVNPPVSVDVPVLVYPAAHVLVSGNYLFDTWDENEPEGSFPLNMVFLQSDKNDPLLSDPLYFTYYIPHDDYAAGDIGNIGFPYRNESRTRINGLGDEGISFINTGRGRDLGAALLALDTRDVENVYVSWLGGTIRPNDRIYNLRMQYRVGFEGDWQDVLVDDQPVEYKRNETENHVQNFDPIQLPSDAVGEDYIQVRWKYYYTAEVTSGARAMLRLDNIFVTTESDNQPPVFLPDFDFTVLVAGSEVITADFNELFEDPDGDPLTITAVSSNENVLTVVVVPADETVEVTPIRAGETVITFSASDGIHPDVVATIRVLVYPEAHSIGDGEFSFSFWSEDEPEGSYPDYMIFLQSDKNDPEVNDPLLYAYFLQENDYHGDDSGNIGYPYRNTRRTRINGLDDDGISFINTGQDRDLGAALVAINTLGQEKVIVTWLGGTLFANSRTYNLRPQYRIGMHDEWNNFETEGVIIEYLRNENAGHTETFVMELPEEALDQEYVQIQWRYYYTGVRLSELSGARDMLRLDEITVYADDGTSVPGPVGIPLEFGLEQNYPNPFNPSTMIGYKIPVESNVLLEVYNLLGQRIAVLVDEYQRPGYYTVQFNAESLPSGVYLYRITTGEFTGVKKMIMIR